MGEAEMTEAAKALTPEETIDLIRRDIAACLDGGPNRKAENIELARNAGIKVEAVSALWDDALKTVIVDLPPLEVVVLPPSTQASLSAEQARLFPNRAEAEAAFFGPKRAEPPNSEAVKVIGAAPYRRDRKPKPEGFFKNSEVQPSVEVTPTTSLIPEAAPAPKDKLLLAVTRKDGVKLNIPTSEDRAKLLDELKEIFKSDQSEERLRYNTRKAEIAEELGVTQMDVHRAVQRLVQQAKRAAEPELTQAQKALAVTFNEEIEFWTDPMDQSSYVSIEVDRHWENYGVDDKAFEAWLRAQYSRRHWIEIAGHKVPGVPSVQALSDAIATMKATAFSNKKEITPALRVGGEKTEIWLDLGMRSWELVKITANGWELVNFGKPNVRFVRKPGMLALPVPVKGGSIQELRPFYNIRDEDFVLLVGWQLGALRPTGPYALLIVTGAAGGGKTTAVRVAQRSFDPNFADLRPFKSEDDMYVGAYNSLVLAFDNISRIKADDADVLARISTGIGYAKRALRTDADQFLMQVCRPIIINAIPDDLADRPDLADRSIVVELPAMDEDKQRGEDEFWDSFKEANPRILGALLDGVAGAIAGANRVDLSGYGRFRMPDFAKFAEAGCRALGFEEGEFLSALSTNSERAMRLAFKQDPVAQAVKLLIEFNPGGWRGNTRPLMDALRRAVTKGKQLHLMDHKSWPKTDTWLGRQLRRSVPVLRKTCGIEIEFGLDLRQTGEGEKDGFEIRYR